MILKRCLFAIVAGGLLTLPLAGCGTPANSTVTENASEDDIAEYKRMIAADEAETEAEEEEEDDDDE